MRRAVTGAVLAAAVLGMVGCSSSAKPAHEQLPPSGASTPANTAPPSTPSMPATIASTSGTSSNATPLSPYESDPAVAALRAWAVQAARAVNARKGYAGAALTALETASFVPLVKNVFASDKGLSYPGPVPFTPVRVTDAGATQRQLSVCFVAYGFAVDPKTHKPPKKLTLFAANVPMIRNGAAVWQVDHIQTTNSFSCSGVKVALRPW